MGTLYNITMGGQAEGSELILCPLCKDEGIVEDRNEGVLEPCSCGAFAWLYEDEQGHLLQKFRLGKVFVSEAAKAAIDAEGVPLQALLYFHRWGIWGPHQRRNWRALEQTLEVFSEFECRNKDKLLILTERDRSETTVLCRSEFIPTGVGSVWNAFLHTTYKPQLAF